MSVSTLNVFDQFTSGSSNAFNFTFYCRSTSWLLVKMDGGLTGAWNAALNTDQSLNPGGTVTFTGPPIGAGHVIRIERHVPLYQPDVYAAYGAFPAQTVEYDFDKAICEMQEIAYALSLVQIPPPSFLTAGMFLQNDGTNLLWADPVPRPFIPGQVVGATSSTVLAWVDNNPIPTPYVPGWVIGASDPTTLEWVPGGTGGGGGITTIGPVVVGQANAAEITGISGNVLQLGIADTNNPGVLDSSAPQRIGGLKLFENEATTTYYDIRLYGGVANDTTKDISQAFYNVQNIAPLSNAPGAISGSGNSCINIPSGIFYTSTPLCTRVPTRIKGADASLTTISVGIAALGGANVPTFAGPVFYNQPPYTATEFADDVTWGSFKPQFSSPLVGATGQSLILSDVSVWTQAFPLHDAWCWSAWLNQHWRNGVTPQFGLQFWLETNETLSSTAFVKGVIGSRGPDVWYFRDDSEQVADQAFGVYAHYDGSDLTLKVFLTTNPDYNNLVHMRASGTLHKIESAPITNNVSHYVELSYNGIVFDLYIDGVNQGEVAATGPIVKAAWEGVYLGAQGPEQLGPPLANHSVEGKIDSIRLSKIARHTGTSSYTPPISKHTWDSDTYALYNWDQGWKTVQPVDANNNPVGSLLTLPFLVGQTVGGTVGQNYGDPGLVGPVPHYIRLFHGGQEMFSHFSDFTILCNASTTGIVIDGHGYWSKIYRVWVAAATKYGICVRGGASFYSQLEDCIVFGTTESSYMIYGESRRCQAQSGHIGMTFLGGMADEFNDQQAYNAYAHMWIYGQGGIYNQISLKNCNNDAEAWKYGRLVAGGVISGAPALIRSENCTWDSSSSAQGTPILCLTTIWQRITHEHDIFVSGRDTTTSIEPNIGNPYAVTKVLSGNLPVNNILHINCDYVNNNDPLLMDTNLQGLVSKITAQGRTNIKGESATDLESNNFIGRFSILGTFDTGGPTFTKLEPDTDYIVDVTPTDYDGVAPASGANRILGYTTRINGFNIKLEAAPGAGSQQNFTYKITRGASKPLLHIFAPTIPSTVDNPLLGRDGLLFAAGATMIPASGDVFVHDESYGGGFPFNQAILSSGTSVGADDYWEILWPSSGNHLTGQVRTNLGTANNSRISNGYMVSLLNPGPHRVVLQGGNGFGYLWLDGQPIQVQGISWPGPDQNANIHIGERPDASAALTLATLRNIAVDTDINKVAILDTDTGPTGKPESIFFGDQFTIGYGATSNGGFASQIANSKYSIEYYWIAATDGILAHTIDDRGGPRPIIFDWLGKSTAPVFQNAVVCLGWGDIISAGKTGTDTFDILKSIIEGGKAQANWIPPTSINGQESWLIYQVPSSAGTDTFTINGRSFSIPWMGSGPATIANAEVLLAADGPTDALFKFGPNANNFAFFIKTKAAGFGGGAYTCTSAGVSGAGIYGDAGGYPVFQVGGTLNFFAGTDNYFTINGVKFIANFDTDITTTVDNAVAAVTADLIVGPLVTATNDSGTSMLVVNNIAGFSGNSIRLGGNGLNSPSLIWIYGGQNINQPTLAGGFNGFITSGTPNIIVCTVPPMRNSSVAWTSGIEAERTALNSAILSYSGAGVTIFDLDALVRDPGDSTSLNPTYQWGISPWLNNDGHTAIVNALEPLLPPGPLTYTTAPLICSNSVAITPDVPIVFGSPTTWTSDPLPTGLSMDASTGIISGTATVNQAPALYEIHASNLAGTTRVYLIISVIP